MCLDIRASYVRFNKLKKVCSVFDIGLISFRRQSPRFNYSSLWKWVSNINECTLTRLLEHANTSRMGNTIRGRPSRYKCNISPMGKFVSCNADPDRRGKKDPHRESKKKMRAVFLPWYRFFTICFIFPLQNRLISNLININLILILYNQKIKG